MRWGSLRLRLVAGGIVAILVALTIAGAGLILLFERHVTRTSPTTSMSTSNNCSPASMSIQQGDLVVTRPPADPRFADPLSGLYWQVADDRGQLLRSRSLWDTTLPLPVDELSPGELHHHEATGPGKCAPAGRRAQRPAHGRRSARAGTRRRRRRSRARIGGRRCLRQGPRARARLLGLVLAIATSIQVGLGLRPLDALRRGVADIRSGRRHHLPAAVPAEVRPLVEEVNALLDAQEQEIERSRSRAADLAHGLKTPLAALAADAARLRERGERPSRKDIEAVGDAMSRHVDRELARARVRGVLRQRGSHYHRAGAARALADADTVADALSRMRVTFEPQIADDVQVPLDRTDLAEVLGNLLENAARHAATGVRITADPIPGPSIVIEDDGPGIAPAQWPRVLERGARLDERGEGAGLGLAIVQDVLSAYGWQISLGTSDLGGLKVKVAPRPVGEFRPRDESH